MKQLCMTCGIRHEALTNRCCPSFRPVSEILPTELHGYLRSRGWKPGRSIRGAGREVYENNEGRELCVPSELVDRDDRSYPRLLEDVLDILAGEEDRTVLDVVDELRPDIASYRLDYSRLRCRWCGRRLDLIDPPPSSETPIGVDDEEVGNVKGKIDRVALSAVDQIARDLSSRKGLDWAWGDIDDDIRKRIKVRWASIIADEVKPLIEEHIQLRALVMKSLELFEGGFVDTAIDILVDVVGGDVG